MRYTRFFGIFLIHLRFSLVLAARLWRSNSSGALQLKVDFLLTPNTNLPDLVGMVCFTITSSKKSLHSFQIIRVRFCQLYIEQ